MRIKVPLLAILVLMLGACSSDADRTASSPATPVTPALDSSPEASTDPLVGSWRAEATCEQQRAAASRAFTPKQVKEAFDCFASEYTIRFQDGRLVQFERTEAGWEGLYKVLDADTFVAGDAGNYYITYEYAIDGNRLTIDMITDDYPASDPKELLGERMAQTIIYESAPFVRMS